MGLTESTNARKLRTTPIHDPARNGTPPKMNSELRPVATRVLDS